MGSPTWAGGSARRVLEPWADRSASDAGRPGAWCRHYDNDRHATPSPMRCGARRQDRRL